MRVCYYARTCENTRNTESMLLKEKNDFLTEFAVQWLKEKWVQNIMRRPGIEPGSTAWKATMLTFTPPTLMANFVQLS